MLVPRSLSPCLRSSLSCHGRLLCLLRQLPDGQQPHIHRLPVFLLACGSLRAAGKLIKKPTGSMVALVLKHSCQPPYRALPGSTLAPLAGGSRCLGSVRNPFVPHSLQPLPSRFSRRRFFLCLRTETQRPSPRGLPPLQPRMLIFMEEATQSHPTNQSFIHKNRAFHAGRLPFSFQMKTLQMKRKKGILAGKFFEKGCVGKADRS